MTGGPLTQQWNVDSFIKIESNRLLREHQLDLHVARYQGLKDYLNNRADMEVWRYGGLMEFTYEGLFTLVCTFTSEWFKLCGTDERAHQYTYCDIPQYYCFNKQTTYWKPRKKIASHRSLFFDNVKKLRYTAFDILLSMLRETKVIVI